MSSQSDSTGWRLPLTSVGIEFRAKSAAAIGGVTVMDGMAQRS